MTPDLPPVLPEQEYKMSDEDFFLLKEAHEDAPAYTASLLGAPSKRLEAWKYIGNKMGFDMVSVRLHREDDRRYFMARPIARANGIGGVEIPDGLPQLPPVPDGYDRWEYRGRVFDTSFGVPTAVYYDDDEPFEIFPYGLGGLGTQGSSYFFEAVKEPTSAPCEPESPKPDAGTDTPNKDLCKWLRDHSSGNYRQSACAADVIEGLESDLAAARAQIEEILRTNTEMYQENGRSRAEIQRLRAALEEIGNQRMWSEMNEEDRERGSFEDGYDSCIEIARSAIIPSVPLAPASSGKGEA